MVYIIKKISTVYYKFSFPQPLRTHNFWGPRNAALATNLASAIISETSWSYDFRIANCSVFFTRTIKVIKGRSTAAKVLLPTKVELIARPNRSLNRTLTVIKLIPPTFYTHHKDQVFFDSGSHSSLFVKTCVDIL